MDISIFGTGYTDLVSVARLAELGNHMMCMAKSCAPRHRMAELH